MSQQNQLEPTGFTTRTIHAVHDARYDASVPPVYLASTFGTAGEDTTYMYQRGANPTRDNLQTTLAALEGAQHAYAYPSGMAATAAALGVLEAGDTLLLGMPTYGGTYRFATIELPARGVKTRFIGDFTALTDEDFTDNVTMVFLESPSNPLLRVSDIAAIAEIAHRNGAIVVVDNTFMTPLLQKPLDLGADISVQSATKYLGGHADLLGGVAATNDDALAERLWHLQMPTDSYRLLQEVKTLKLRLTQQQKNTIEVINYLEAHPAVKRVLYAGSHSEYEAQVHARQANGLGALISMELVDGADLPAFLEALKIFSHAVSLGGIESLVVRPALMVQAAYTQAHRDEYGVSDNLIRLAIGIEEIEDIIEDLERGLTAALAHQA